MSKRSRLAAEFDNMIEMTKHFEEETMSEESSVKSHIFRKIRASIQLQSKGYDIDEDSLIGVIVSTLPTTWVPYVKCEVDVAYPKDLEHLFDVLSKLEGKKDWDDTAVLCDAISAQYYNKSSPDDDVDHVSQTQDNYVVDITT